MPCRDIYAIERARCTRYGNKGGVSRGGADVWLCEFGFFAIHGREIRNIDYRDDMTCIWNHRSRIR